MKKRHTPIHRLTTPDSYRLKEEEYMEIVWNHKLKKCSKGCFYQQDRIVCPNYHDEEDRRRTPRRKLPNGEFSNQSPWAYQSVSCINVIETMYYPTNFKTKNCSFFEENGSCHIGKVCSFRHVYNGIDYDSNCNMFNRPLVISEDRYRYMALEYKTEKCKIPSHPPKDLRVPWWNCPYWHDESDRRTLEETHRDVENPPEHTENIITRFCHPLTLMTRMCKEEKKCNHPYCRFAHSDEEVEMVEKYRQNLINEQHEARKPKPKTVEAKSAPVPPTKPSHNEVKNNAVEVKSPPATPEKNAPISPHNANNNKSPPKEKEPEVKPQILTNSEEEFEISKSFGNFGLNSSSGSVLSPLMSFLSEDNHYEQHPYLETIEGFSLSNGTGKSSSPLQLENLSTSNFEEGNVEDWMPNLNEFQQINDSNIYVNVNFSLGEPKNNSSNVFLGVIKAPNPIQVAIKITQSHYHPNSSDMERESRYLETLNHPNVVRIYGSGKLDNPTADKLKLMRNSGYVVMGLFGDSMLNVLERLWNQENSNFHLFYTSDRQGQIFPTRITINLARDILRGIAYLNSKEILHKDIKPTNILVDIQGISEGILNPQVKVADFQSSTPSTPPNVFNSAWQPPEIVFNPRSGAIQHSPSSEMYSAALVLYFLFTLGKHPLLDSEDGRYNPSWFDDEISAPENIITSNIMQTKKGAFQVTCNDLNHIPVAKHLIVSMLGGPYLETTKRMTIYQALNHPFFWTPSEQLRFIQLMDTSVNRSNSNLELFQFVESLAPHVLMASPVGNTWVPTHSNASDTWMKLVKRCNESMFAICGRGYNFNSVCSLINMLYNLLLCMNHSDSKDPTFARDIYHLIGKTTLDSVANVLFPKFPLLISGLHLAYCRFKDLDENLYEVSEFIRGREHSERIF